MLKHLAFFEELAQLEETDPSWNSISAGLVVLRLVDAWIVEGAKAVNTDAWAIRAVRTAIAEMSDRTPIRSILSGVVDSIQDAGPSDMRRIAPRLLAYGQALEYEAKWSLAADVFETIIAHVHPIDDADIATMAHLRLALCLHDLGDLKAAAATYETAGEISRRAGDIVGVLRSRIGEARIAVKRGNLPDAEIILDDTIARAQGPELQDIRARALNERSTVAGYRGHFELAIRLAYEALESSLDVREKDRILSNISAAFLELGVLSAARDGFLVLAATAQEQYVRWAASLNLLDIAVREMVQPTFEHYRRELAAADLPPYVAASFELTSGEGYQRFGDFDRARASLERARVLAEEHGYAQLLFSAEDRLAAVARQQLGAAQLSAPVPGDLAEIAASIREMGRRFAATG